MPSELEKLQKSHKTLQPRIKALKLPEATKRKKAVKTALDAAWDGQDDLTKAVKKAMANGVTGSKPADFAKDDGYKAALAVWKKCVEAHQKSIKELKDYCNAAYAVHDTLQKLLSDTNTALKKSGDTSKDSKKFTDTLTADAKTAKSVANVLGTMTAPELMYAANFQRTLEFVLKKASGTAKKAKAGDPVELLSEKTRNKNARHATQLAKDISSLCDTARDKAATDPHAAIPVLKKLNAAMTELKELNDDYQNAQKKGKSILAASPDKSKMLRAIGAVKRACTLSQTKHADIVATLKKGEAAQK